jgi:hypothetical protein
MKKKEGIGALKGFELLSVGGIRCRTVWGSLRLRWGLLRRQALGVNSRNDRGNCHFYRSGPFKIEAPVAGTMNNFKRSQGVLSPVDGERFQRFHFFKKTA